MPARSRTFSKRKRRKENAKPRSYSCDIKISPLKIKEATGSAVQDSRCFFRRFSEIAQWDREAFFVVTMNQKNRIIDNHLIALGTLTETFIHPREVYKPAILDSAANVAFLHNHPSGDPTPSDEDKMLTVQLKNAGAILGIGIVDHVIIGQDGYTSFVDNGWI